MAGTIKGIIVEIGGDTSGLQKALKNVNSATSNLTKELRGVNSLLKLDPTNTELVAQKQTILAQNIEETSEKLKVLKEAQQKADDAIKNGTQISDENYRNLQREIINTENKLKDLQVQASKWTTAGKTVEEYGNKIQTLGTKIDDVGNKLTTRLTLPLAALGIAGVQSAAKQEAAMQQVELIYGDAADEIKNFAENTAISFNMSTSDAYKYSQIYGNLIQSITDDEEENALYTQQLLKASSVIASATGRTMEDVMDRIRSGLLGNTEAIEDLGVNVNVSLLESTDAFKKFAGDKSWNQLDFQTQQQIRLFGILEQTTKKYGDEVNQNTASDIQRLTAKFKNLTSNLSKKLLPIADKLIDKAENFLDKLEDLDDEQLENIVNIGLMVAAAGPLVKIFGTATKTVGGVTKGVGLFSQAIAVATNKTTSNVTAVNKLANAFKFIKSPIGLATTAIGLLIAGLMIAIDKYNETAFSLEETTKKLESAKQAQDEFNQSVSQNYNTQMSEIENVETLSKELNTLVDKNGKVKDGYEGRVKFILNKLNPALGTEYKLNGKIIDSYDELKKSIDELIQKKRADIILSSEEEKYNEAINKKAEAYENLTTAQEELAYAQERYEEAKKTDKQFDGGAWKAQVEEAQKNVDVAKEIYDSYLNDIANYEKDYETIMTGSNEEIEELINKRTYTYKSSSGDMGEVIAHNIQQVQSEIEYYKTAYATDLANKDKYNAEKNLKQKQANEEELKNLAQQLFDMTSTTEELTPYQIEAWKSLATGSYDIYKEYVNKMSPEMQKEIDKATGVISSDTQLVAETRNLAIKARNTFRDDTQGEESGKSFLDDLWEGVTNSDYRNKVIESIANLGNKIISKFQNIAEGKESGKDFIKGIQEGISNTEIQSNIFSTVWNLGKNILASLNNSLDEHSPSRLSEESGINFVQGTINGITSKEKEALNLVSKFGSNLITKFNNSFKGSINALPSANLSSRVIDSTKTIFTTPQIIFNVQELDEAKLQQCFNYINRKFGSQY